jgi:electron transport complex protein RnfB
VIELILQNPLIAALVALVGLALVFGAVLGFAAIKFRIEGDPIVQQIDELLPQTQCGQCGYPGCRPYAQAIANGDAINKCPPGGQSTINALATLLGVEAPSLDAEHGEKMMSKPWRISARTNALAAPSVSRPARWMPFSAQPR